MVASIIARTAACSPVTKAQSRASSSWVILPRMVPRASWASVLGLRSPAAMASSMARPETPWMPEITLDSFRCVLQQLLHPLLLGGAGLGQVPPVAGVGAQPADLLGGHEAAWQRAPLGDLRQPDGVQLVFSELRK
jgi:hypothetical protein